MVEWVGGEIVSGEIGARGPLSGLDQDAEIKVALLE